MIRRAVRRRTCRSGSFRIGNGGIDSLKKACVFGRRFPNFRPLDGVDPLGVSKAIAGIQDVLGRVFTLGSRQSAVSRKVGRDSRGFRSDFAEVDSFTSISDQQDVVKQFKEQRRRLVNGTENSESKIGEVAKQANDLEGGIRVEA